MENGCLNAFWELHKLLREPSLLKFCLNCWDFFECVFALKSILPMPSFCNPANFSCEYTWVFALRFVCDFCLIQKSESKGGESQCPKFSTINSFTFWFLTASRIQIDASFFLRTHQYSWASACSPDQGTQLFSCYHTSAYVQVSLTLMICFAVFARKKTTWNLTYYAQLGWIRKAILGAYDRH